MCYPLNLLPSLAGARSDQVVRCIALRIPGREKGPLSHIVPAVPPPIICADNRQRIARLLGCGKKFRERTVGLGLT